MIFRSGQLLLPERAQKPNNDINPLGNPKSIFAIDSQEEEWDLFAFIQNVHGPKPRVNIPTQSLEVLRLRESDDDYVCET